MTRLKVWWWTYGPGLVHLLAVTVMVVTVVLATTV